MIQETEQTIAALSVALEKIADNVMITDPGGTIEYVNPAFEETTGYSREQAVGQNPKILRSGAHGADYYRQLWKTILSGHVFRATTTNRKKNGDVYYADQTITPVVDSKGDILCFVSVWKDITERIVAEERLKYERKKLEQVLGIEADLHRILDLNKLIDFVVQKTCQVLEAETCTIMFLDQDSGELCIKGHRGIEESIIAQSSLRIGDEIKDLIEQHHKAKARYGHGAHQVGSLFQSDTFLSVPIELKDHVLGIINVSHKLGNNDPVFTDLDLKILLMIVRQVRIAIDNAQLYRELKFISMTDALTGLYNYRYLAQTLDYEIMRAHRYKRDLSFLMIDIDQLKSYNDTFGHLEGDQLIKAIAKVIVEAVRAPDIVCRYGGDEFAVVLPETDPNQARIVAEKIRKNVSGLSLKQEVSVSIGVAKSTPQSTRHELVQRADSHLYTAKQNGKNQISG